MAPLKSLEVDFPLINSDFQHFCASQGIFSAYPFLLTVEDFLMRDLDMLVSLAEQYPTSDRLKEGITQIISIIDSQHQPWQNALELLEDSERSKQFLSVGCQRIDEFLHGGLQQGFVTELVGPSSSGKTQICLLAASNIARTYSGKVMFIDTGNSFTAKRIAEFVNQSADHGFVADTKILRRILDNIVCHSVFDIFNLLDVLHELLNSLTYQRGHNLKMLIVDSISSLITPVLGGTGGHGHALMACTGFLLKKLAHDHNLAILITNHMVAGEGGITKPALGESWKSIPHVRLMVSRNPATNISRMSVLMHPAMAVGATVEYTILY